MSQRLAEALLAGKGLPHDAGDSRLIETHISWVILAGDFAYKIKKPLDLGFLDFSTLEKRRFFCEEEVRLNRRTAPDIYLEVVSFSGTESDPHIGDGGTVFEYAVKMKRVVDLQDLDDYAQQHALGTGLVRRLAESVASFHESLSPRDSLPGGPGQVFDQNEANFETLVSLDKTTSDQALVSELRDWHKRSWQSLTAVFQQRLADGHVRECHGDLHLGNIFTDGSDCILFDCIEFSEELRVIDTACDLAFLLMDLHHQHGATSAHLLLNEYLQLTGDYACLPVLGYYMVYRALVRAKVDTLRAEQSGDADLARDCTRYLELARSFTHSTEPVLVMMCGLSGTGKTTVGRELASELGAIHLRSDVERKRLFNLAPTEASREQGLDIYTAEASRETFARLESLSHQAINAGYAVLVDATFIEQEVRQRFIDVATERGIGWKIVQCTAPRDVVERRLQRRTGDASEAGFEQYLAQADRFDAFTEAEQAHLVTVDTSRDVAVVELAIRFAAFVPR